MASNITADPHVKYYGSLRDIARDPIWEHHFVDASTEPTHVPLVFDLDVSVHHLWRWKAFRNYAYSRQAERSDYDKAVNDMPNSFYRRIFPALQLATIYLQRAAPLLVRILRGPNHSSPDGEYLDPDWVPRPGDYTALNRELTDLSREYRILYRESTSALTGFAYGVTTFALNNDNLSTPVISAIAAEVLDEFHQDSWETKTPFQCASVLVKTAAVLIHELAHAIRGRRLKGEARRLRRRDLYAQMARRDPSVHPDSFSELGHSLERLIFGCDTAYPWSFFTTRFETNRGARGPNFNPVFDGTLGLLGRFNSRTNHRHSEADYPYSVRTIMSFFDKRTWAAPKQIFYFIMHRASYQPTSNVPYRDQGPGLQMADPTSVSPEALAMMDQGWTVAGGAPGLEAMFIDIRNLDMTTAGRRLIDQILNANVPVQGRANAPIQPNAIVPTRPNANMQIRSDVNVPTQSSTNVPIRPNANASTQPNTNMRTQGGTDVSTPANTNTSTQTNPSMSAPANTNPLFQFANWPDQVPTNRPRRANWNRPNPNWNRPKQQ